jgi:cyclopropane-fatty-acyl-phospholipid synthase
MSNVALSFRDTSVEITFEFLDALFAAYPRRDFAVRLWNDEVWGNGNDPRFTIVLKHPASLRRMLLGSNELKLGESYIFDDFDIEGDIEAAFDFGDYLIAHELELTEKLHLAGLLLRLPHHDHRHGKLELVPHLRGRLHSKQRDQRAVTYHYNLSNDFYQLWLDQQMVYSCAYFERGDEDIDVAQRNKLDYICRKLRLKPDERLLDVGCGWGGLAMYAARYFGVQALGVTLSKPQAELARQRIDQFGLSDRCEVRVCDYRDLDEAEPYDKIVSVGMFEHVGEPSLEEYFAHIWRLLRSGGIFLNHGIAASALFRRKGSSFIDKYVFPDGGLVPLGTTIRTAEACGFEVRDVESLREHYARTLRHWVRRLESRYEDAKRMTGETVYRIWRIYMAGSAHAFATGRVNLYQVLFSKSRNGQAHLPLTRADWYVHE